MAVPMLANLGSAIQKVGSAASNATSTISGLGSALVHQLMGPLEVIKGIAGALTPLVRLANPAALFLFNRALDNFQAIIGQLVTPVLQGLTKYLEIMGDTLAGLMPVVQPVFNQLAQSMVNIAVGAAQVVQAAAPFIQLLADGLVYAMQKAGEAIAFFQGVLSELIKALASAFGLENRFDARRKAKGAAVYEPTVSSVEDFANKQFAESLKGINQNRGGGKKPEEFIPEIAAAIEKGREIVNKILGKVTFIATWFEKRMQEAGALGEGANAGAHGDIKGMLDGFRKALIS